LQQEGLAALQHAEASARKTRSMLARPYPMSARLDAGHLHSRVFEKFIKQADRVAAAADAGDEFIREPALARENLLLRLLADDAVKIAHHHRVRVGTVGRAQDVMRAADVSHPVAHGLVDGL